MKFFKYLLSSFAFFAISFLSWMFMSKILGCPLKNITYLSDRMNLMPIVIIWNGLFFTLWFSWISSKYDIKPWQFGIVSFWLTRYFGELYMYVQIKEYTFYIMSFGMLHGLISSVLSSVIIARIIKKA